MLNIAIELGVLGLFAFIYYLWQKKRIINRSKSILYSNINDIINQLENLDQSKFSSDIQALKQANENDHYSELKVILFKLEQEDLNWPKDIFEDLDFHNNRK